MGGDALALDHIAARAMTAAAAAGAATAQVMPVADISQSHHTRYVQ